MIHIFIVCIVIMMEFAQDEGCNIQGNQCPYDVPPDKGCEIDVADRRQSTHRAEVMGSDARSIDSLQYPYMVSLQTWKCENSDTKCYKHFCGGSMIAENLILTAAHCFDDFKSRNSKERLNGGLQYYTLKEEIYAAVSPPCRHLNGTYGRFQVHHIFIHPEYQQNEGRVPLNDVAIVDIYSNSNNIFYEGPFVKIVGAESTENVSEAQVLGYGQTQKQNNNTKYIAEPLQGAQLNLLTFQECKAWLSNDKIASDELNYTNMICYHNQRADACDGDSGGPLLSNEEIQIGLVSWGPKNDCKSEDALQTPGVYVRLTLFADWIQQLIKELSNTTPFSPQEPCICDFSSDNQTKNCFCSPVNDKTQILSLSDQDLYNLGVEGIGQCEIQALRQGATSENAFCDFYVKSGIIGVNSQGVQYNGYPLNMQCEGSGCVKAPDQKKERDFCPYSGAEYSTFVNSRIIDYCTDSGVANAAAQLRDAIKYDACNCTAI